MRIRRWTFAPWILMSLWVTPLATGQTPHFTFTAEFEKARLGWSVESVVDANNDGVRDLLVGAPESDAGGYKSGAVFVFSGADGSVIHRVVGENWRDELGWSVTGLDDLNGDGYYEFAAGARGFDDERGRVNVYSGLDQSVLYSYEGEDQDHEFWRVEDAGDVNGDGVGDFMIGARKYNGAGWRRGKVYLYSGVDGTFIRSMVGAHDGAYFGYSMAAVGDLNADGFADIAIGAPWDDTHGTLNEPGAVYVYSGLDGSVIEVIYGEINHTEFGKEIESAGDLTGDGVPDLIIGAPDFNPFGMAYLYSGSDFSLIKRYSPSWTNDNMQFGDYLAGLGDVDGDGVNDVAISSVNYGPNGDSRGGTWIYSGATGVLIMHMSGTSIEGGWFGKSAHDVGDLNGDGLDDFIIGSPFAIIGDNFWGQAYVFQGARPATIVGLSFPFGFIVRGTIGNMFLPDNKSMVVNSEQGFSASEPNIVEMNLAFITDIPQPKNVWLTTEGRQNNPGGVAKFRARNWETGQLDQFATHAMDLIENRYPLDPIDAALYVRSTDGRIEVNLKHVVLATFTPQGFESELDEVKVLVN